MPDFKSIGGTVRARAAFELRDAKGMFVPTWFVPLEETRMQKKQSAKLIDMTDLQWEFFFTCWKYNLEFWRGGSIERYKYTLGVPLYYRMLARRLFGTGVKYPLYRLAGWPDRFMTKHLYLNFTGKARSKEGLKRFEAEIPPVQEGADLLRAAGVKYSVTVEQRSSAEAHAFSCRHPS